MRNRYKVAGAWSSNGEGAGRFLIQVADALDQQTNTIYREGAYRVIDTHTGKPAKVGKGGTVPFIGESAWSAAERLANDLYWKARNAS